MYRNQYDTDVTVWSPQGRLHQVEYAMEAVKQGSVCVGLRSNNFVVLGGLKRAPSRLASHQEKIFRIDDHMGIAMSGLTADGRVLARFMRTECLNHKFTYETPMETGRLVYALADKHQRCTQSYVRRPYGVGLLVAGYDVTGPHLFQTCPSGNYFEYKAIAIGARSQSAKTYLERYFQRDDARGTPGFDDLSADDLVVHAIKALRASMHGDEQVTLDNLSIGVVGADRKFEVLSVEQLRPLLERVNAEAAPEGGAGAEAAADMEVDA